MFISKKIFNMFYAFTILLLFIPVVNAGGLIPDSYSYSHGTPGGGPGGYCKNDCALNYEGMRISLITTDGTIKSVKNYYFISGGNPNSLGDRNTWNGGQCSKVNYLMGTLGCDKNNISGQ